MSFATQLKILRARHNVTQQELADYLNVTRPTIAGYETKGKEPDYSTLLLLSSYFHVSIDYLLTGKEFPDTIEEKCFLEKNKTEHNDVAIIQTKNNRIISQIIENVTPLENADLIRMLDYSELLLLQSQYKNSIR